MQSETGFPSSHQLKSYVASKSRLKLAARAVLSADAGLLVVYCYLQYSLARASSSNTPMQCRLIMAALWNRAGHCIFALWFFFFLSIFFPRLISAVVGWMSTELAHMVWP